MTVEHFQKFGLCLCGARRPLEVCHYPYKGIEDRAVWENAQLPKRNGGFVCALDWRGPHELMILLLGVANSWAGNADPKLITLH